MKLPKHKASLHLTHNQHKAYYESVEQYVASRGVDDSEWATPESKKKAIENDELWELQWYPNTPVSFYLVLGATLEEVLARSMEIDRDEH